MSDDPTYPPEQHLVLLNEEMKGRMDAQSDEFDGLDRKVTTILSATGVVLALVINNIGQFPTGHGSIIVSVALFYGTLFALAAGLIVGLVTYFPRDVDVVPKPASIVDAYYAKTTVETLAQLVVTRRRAYELNIHRAKRKGRGLKAQMVLLGSGGMGLVLAYTFKELFHA